MREAPKGRLIQPQVQTIRELLDKGCTALCCTPEGMEGALAALAAPRRSSSPTRRPSHVRPPCDRRARR